MTPSLLLLGASTRALAASVRRSGYRGPMLALDLFADLDQELLCRCWTPGRDIPGPRGTASLLRAAARLGAPGRGRSAPEIVFTGGMETHPRLLGALERRLRVVGNRAADVRAVRDPKRFFAFLASSDIPHPRTWFPAPGDVSPRRAPLPLGRGRLLWKPRLAGGGRRIRTAPPWPARGGYLQERVGGTPGSVAFVADGRRARVLGTCRMLSGEAGMGAAGLAYSGNLYGPPGGWLPRAARTILARAVRLLTARFHLRGLNGIDFVLDRGRPLLLEVNPRWSASMELIEEGWGRSLYPLHRRACLHGRLPAPGSLPAGGGGEDRRIPLRGWIGKGIVYATRPIRISELGPFFRTAARDIPRPGTTIRAGAPLCTVVARAASAGLCRRRLLAKAARLHRSLYRSLQALGVNPPAVYASGAARDWASARSARGSC